MKNLLIALTFILISSQIFAGAWTQKKGSGYYQLSFQYLSGDEFHGPDGDKYSFLELTNSEVNFYGEYGLTNEVTVFANFPFYKSLSGGHICNDPAANCIPVEVSKSGISDLTFGTRIKIAKFGQTFFSGTVRLGIPTGDGELEQSLRLGDGEFNQAVSFNIGHSLYPLPGFLSFSLGYNNKTEGYSDEIFSGLEGGYSFFDRNLLVMLKMRMVFAVGNGDGTFKGGINKLYENDQQYVAITPELAYKLTDNIGINASATTGFLAENIISAIVYRVGIYFTH